MSKLKVLMVDDEKDFLDIMGQRVLSWDYEVITAANGKDAINAVNLKDPDIIILDYIMPDTNGIELLKKIRAIDKKIPVIMFTAKPESEAIKAAEGLDIAAFVPKLSPYTDTQNNLKAALTMAAKKR